MKKIIVMSLASAVTLFAALPTQQQNIKDLAVMVDFVKTHPKVAATIREISVVDRTVYFGAGCKAIFKRKASIRPSGMVGPAEPLELKRTTCPLDK
jgi:hypothetical protein